MLAKAVKSWSGAGDAEPKPSKVGVQRGTAEPKPSKVGVGRGRTKPKPLLLDLSYVGREPSSALNEQVLAGDSGRLASLTLVLRWSAVAQGPYLRLLLSGDR